MSEEQPSKKQKVDFVMQTDLIAAADKFIETAQVISYTEAVELWKMALDGPGVTQNEFKTLQHILETYKLTDKAKRYLSEMAIQQVSGKSQYKTIAKVKYDRSCLDLATHLAKDGSLDLKDAELLWADVQDGPGVTETERRTIVYIMDNFTLTSGAKEFFVKNLQEKMNLKLMYFNGRGLMEVPRMLLATVGKFAPADFEDFRFKSHDDFFEAQKTGELGHENMNRVPLCMHLGKTIGQGKAINRYLAKVFGLAGATDIETAMIDNICEHVDEIGVAFGKVMPYGNEFKDEEKAAIVKVWLDTPAEEGNKERSKRALRWHLTHLEHCVGDDGYSFGGKPTLADALMFNKLGDHVPSLGDKGDPFEVNKSLTDAVLADYPKIRKIVDTFGSSAGMKKYLSDRGAQNF